jgi:hypothetical protein
LIKPKFGQSDLTVIGLIQGGEVREIIEGSKGKSALWHIESNPLLPEPLVAIYINDRPLITLADSGSEVNCVSSQQIELLGLTDKIQKTESLCCGPSGNSINTSGEIYLEFSLGNESYSTIFLVLHLAKSTAGIVGYQFMKNNNINIHCGKAITNDQNYVPDVEERCNSNPEYLNVRPVQDYEVSQHSVRSINLQISDYPKRMLAGLLLTPFYIFKKDSPPQVSTLSQLCMFEYTLENKTSL